MTGRTCVVPPVTSSRACRSGAAERVAALMKRRIGDRRLKTRFEIVGELWGSLDASATLSMRNVSAGGALLESPVPLVPESIYEASAYFDDEPQPVRFRVRHSVKMSGAREPRYLTGIEFVRVTAAVEAFIQRQLEPPPAAAIEGL